MRDFKWEKLGRFLLCNKHIPWMSTWTGASFARQISNSSVFEIFVTGRDERNISRIGKVIVDLKSPLVPLEISNTPCLDIGDLGAFDENGVSYPYLYQWAGRTYMLYVGWMPTVLTPFMNCLGLARENDDGTFERVSKAPILPRDNNDYLSIGSSGVFLEKDFIRLYYTSFLRWGKGCGEHKHYYVIKYAESNDGIIWQRSNRICIDILYNWEFSICRPTVIKIDNLYHMWFSYRGDNYKIGYANSKDGKHWTRNDSLTNIGLSDSGWDSKMICYSHVFQYKEYLYMLYCGNNYGQDGLGLARARFLEQKK